MKGAVNPEGPLLSFFSTEETEEEEKPAHFASSIQLHNKQLLKVSSGKPPAEAAAGGFWFARVQQAASFPRALVVVCHLVSTRSTHTHKHGQAHTHLYTNTRTHTHTSSHAAGGGSRSGSRAPAVLLIKYPKVMLRPLHSHSEASLRCENTSAGQNTQTVTSLN